MSLREWVRRQYSAYLQRTLSATPDHVAVIQDGNRRYAESRGLERADGHAQGASTTESLLEWCLELPAAERASLFDLITEKLYEFADADRIHDNAVCIRGLGAIDRLPPRLQDAVAYAEAQTNAYDQLRLNIALAYGGRHELLQAARRVTASVAAGEQAGEAITTDTVEAALYRESLPDVDLLIRTGGNRRTSNFLPWHAVGARSAVYFTDAYWPDFSRRAFLQALHTYATRKQSFRRRQQERVTATAAWLRRQTPRDTPANTDQEGRAGSRPPATEQHAGRESGTQTGRTTPRNFYPDRSSSALDHP
jgi:tritrans,polycis-undecaprenyl-diphosphate synthase [geranylgeranyl-diphosphate specific]